MSVSPHQSTANVLISELQASSDEGTMSSIVVANNRVTLTPRSGTYSYLYSQFDCVSATNKYGGISLRIKAAAGTSLAIDLQSSSNCNPTSPTSHVLSASQLGWTFDGTEKLYSIPFNKFSGLDTGKLTAIVFQGINVPVTLGPVAFYCGNTPSEYQLPRATTTASPTATVPATTATATGFVIDRFANPNTNALGFYHGGDEPSQYSISSGRLTIRYSDADYSYYTQLSGSCRDITSLDQGYIHITYSGSTQFTIALQQHNPTCNPSVAPYPETWDVVHASRYAVSSTDIYIPLSHFSVVKSRVIGLAFKSFSSGASNPTTFSLVEFVRTIPSGISIPSKIKTAPLVFACTRPNSFAFAIDDGIPEFAQTVMSVIKSEGIKVTFFTVGAALLDESTNLTSVYREALADGHQVALHSFTHPKMEGLPATRDIEWEIKEDVAAVKQTLGIESKYFRPPFGNEGARFREALERLIPGSRLINWSVDVQDWLWGESNTPEVSLG